MTRSAFSDEYRSLIEHLVDLRRTAGITQVELAAKLGRPQSFVSKYERGERRLDLFEFAQIAEAVAGDPIVVFSDIYRRWAATRPSA